MNFRLLYIMIMFVCVNFGFAQESEEVLASNSSSKRAIMATEVVEVKEKSLWHTSTARTIQAGRTESGIFAPLRIGLKNKAELSIHPLAFFVMPNAKIKKNWMLNESNKLQVATESGFTFPTILLNLLAKNGVGGIFPANRTASPILTIKNKVIVSYFYHQNHAVSIKAGMEFNLLQSLSDNNFPDLELLILYPRMASYNNFYSGEVELAFTGTVARKFGYDADLRMFLIPNDDFTWVFEWNPKLYYNVSNKFRVMAGALLTTGNIPNEKAAFRAIPVLDLQFSFAKKNKKRKK